MRETGDMESAAVLDVIYNDEKGHVAIGAKWFRFLCARERKDPAATFRQLVAYKLPWTAETALQ